MNDANHMIILPQRHLGRILIESMLEDSLLPKLTVPATPAPAPECERGWVSVTPSKNEAQFSVWKCLDIRRRAESSHTLDNDPILVGELPNRVSNQTLHKPEWCFELRGLVYRFTVRTCLLCGRFASPYAASCRSGVAETVACSRFQGHGCL